MNCYICGGFLLARDKHLAGKKVVHRNCWGRLGRKQQRIIEETSAFKSEKNINTLNIYRLREVGL